MSDGSEVNPGKFIVLEGGDGSGKTGCLQALKEKYPYTRDGAGQKFVFTREPGGTSVGEQIRSKIFEWQGIDPYTELCLFTASRREHVTKVILPALRRGVNVVSDRYVASSFAYQICGWQQRHLEDALKQLTKWVETDPRGNSDEGWFWLKPQYIFLDVDPKIGRQRTSKRSKEVGAETTRFDLEEEEFHRRAYEGYKRFPLRNLHLCNPEYVGWHQIDAGQPQDQVIAAFIEKVEEIVAE